MTNNTVLLDFLECSFRLGLLCTGAFSSRMSVFYMDEDIRALQEILELEGRHDLADLLSKSTSKVRSSGTYGSQMYSVLSSFEIYSPVKENFILKKKSDQDHRVIFDSVLQIYPVRSEAPEIVEVEFLIASKTSSPIIDQSSLDIPEKVEGVVERVRIFISYSTEEKKLAGAFSKYLQDLNFEVFLAHKDIEPSKVWQEEILERLKTSHVFLPILTINFKESKWTDQESGIAFNQGLKIIPINVQLQPYGFLGRYQSLPLKPGNITPESVREACGKVLDILRKDGRWNNILRKADIYRFINSPNFDSARLNLKNLAAIKDFSKHEIEEVIKGASINNQIYGAGQYDDTTRPILIKIADKYKDIIDPVLYEQFLQKFS